MTKEEVIIQLAQHLEQVDRNSGSKDELVQISEMLVYWDRIATVAVDFLLSNEFQKRTVNFEECPTCSVDGCP